MPDERLKEFIETASGVSPFRVEDDFGNGFVRLRTEEAERRQAAHDIRCTEDVVIEALRNARDAHARSIFLAASKEGGQRTLVMVDDGDGVPPSMHERIFEPRVTSKLDTVHMDKWGVHGRGMALFSIACNCEEARVAWSDAGKGAAFVFASDTARLAERADQSSFPTFHQTEAGSVAVRGPRNILRTACEFALDSAKDCTVYVGSPAEIAATLHAFAVSSLTPSQRAFCADEEALPACKQLGAASDPASFRAIAVRLGLSLSERTCRRILDGAIAPLGPITDRVRIEAPAAARKRPRAPKALPQDARGLRIDPLDAQLFADALRRPFADLARSYYLEPDVQPDVRVERDRIVVSFPVQKL